MVRFSAMLLGAAYIAAPSLSVAQERGHESHSVQTAPNRMQPNNGARAQGNQRRENIRPDAGRWNNGQRWNNNARPGNNFGSAQPNDRCRDQGDRNHRDGDRDRGRDRDRDRDRHDRGRGNLGFYYGGDSFYPYYTQEYYYGAPYGYYNTSAYELGYSDGFNAGRSDRLQGFLYDPRRYERSGDPEYFRGFVAGYEDGWRG
jgi:hypothetical protein